MKQSALLLIMAVLSIITITGQKLKAIDGEKEKCESRFNPETVEAVNGTILKIEQISTRDDMAFGTHLTIDVQGEELAIHVGPSWYLERMDFDFKKGDSVDIIGSKIRFDNKPAIIASTIQQRDVTLALRDENGKPKWSELCKNKKGGSNCRYKS